MKRVLVVRNDRLGDFMLIWPALALLKQVSKAHISVLVPAYTAPMAQLCASIDAVIIDPGPQAEWGAQRALLQQIKDQQFDCAIAVFSNGRNARMLWQANIPNRFAPATKWAQLLYNHRLRQRRSQSAQPEWRYNVDLIRFALKQQGYNLPVSSVQQQIKHHVYPLMSRLERDQINGQPVSPLGEHDDNTYNAPYLTFEPQVLSDMRHQVASNLGLNVAHRWLIVHPGTGGSAGILATAQYVQFICAFIQNRSQPADSSHLTPQSLLRHADKTSCEPFDILVTAGPNETELAETLVQALSLQGLKAVVLTSQDGLVAFAQVIANSALFLAASTGPLHMASALDVPTVGVFAARRSNTALRWQPLNQPSRHWPISVPNDALDPEDLTVINWAQAGVLARDWFDKLTQHT
jgi:ADP-heptose:LPS heptosyltransferase